MSLPNIEILCQKIEFTDKSLHLNKRNIYNPSAAYTNVGSVVDLADFMDEPPKLSSSKVKKDEFAENPTLVYEYGDIRLNLSGIAQNYYLQSYLNIYDRTGNWAFQKFLITFKYSGVVYFNGIIDNASIEEPFGFSSNLSDMEIIPVNIYSRDKEFRDYQQSRMLPSPDNIYNYFFEDLILPWYWDDRSEDNHTRRSQSSRIKPFIQTLLENRYLMNCYVDERWEMVNVPQLFNSTWSGNWFCKSGYKRWHEEGLTVMEFIQYLCNATGWVLEFEPLTNLLILKNRAEFFARKITIDFDDVQNWVVKNNVANNIKHVLIQSGFMQSQVHYGSTAPPLSDDPTLSQHWKIISSEYDDIVNESNSFTEIRGNSGYDGNRYVTIQPLNFKFTCKGGETYHNNDFREGWKTNEGPPAYDFTHYPLRKGETLLLDAGTQTQWQNTVDLDDTRNDRAQGFPDTNWQKILFAGNVGDCLVMRNPASPYFLINDYHGYCKSQQFKNNFAPYIVNAGDKIIEVWVNGIYLDPNVSVDFSNYPEEFFMGDWAIDTMEPDFKSMQTKFTLIRQ